MIIVFKDAKGNIYIDFEDVMHLEGTLNAKLGTTPGTVTIVNLVRNIDLATNVEFSEFVDENFNKIANSAQETVDELLNLFTGESSALATRLKELSAKRNP